MTTTDTAPSSSVLTDQHRHELARLLNAMPYGASIVPPVEHLTVERLLQTLEALRVRLVDTGERECDLQREVAEHRRQRAAVGAFLVGALTSAGVPSELLTPMPTDEVAP